MKKLLLVAALSVASLGSYAQGYLNFANIGGGPAGTVNAPITNATVVPAVRANGNTVLAMLYVAPAGTLDELLLTTNGVAGGPAPFNTGGQAGYFTGGQRVITGFNGGQTVTVQVRAWIASAGATYDEARAFNPLMVEESNLIQIVLQSAPNTPNNMVGLNSFTIGIPEPSSIALGLLGLGAIALFRRRK
jgi:hypothetical protein